MVAAFNQKGGVGEATTTHNLIAAPARCGKFPRGIDLSPAVPPTLASGVRGLPGAETLYAFDSELKPLSHIMRALPAGLI